MSGTASNDEPGPDSAAAAPHEDRLARAAAQGPLFIDDENRDRNDASNLEAAESHDSPAAIDEGRAARGTAHDSDRLYDIYGPPPSERQERSRE